MCPTLLSSWPSKKGDIFRQVCKKAVISVIVYVVCLRCENMHGVLPPPLSEPVPTADYDGCIAKIIIIGE